MYIVQRQDLVDRLKFHLSIGDVTDPILSKLTDEELDGVIKIKALSMKLTYPHFDPDNDEEVLCLARKEIYWKMALVSAPLYEMSMGDLRVSKQVRFEHYMELIEKVEQEYYLLKNDPKRNKITVGEAYVNKYYSRRQNINNYNLPDIHLNIDEVTQVGVNCSIAYSNLIPKDFVMISIYTSQEAVIDKYSDVEADFTKAKHVLEIRDIHKKCFRVKEPMKYITVVLRLINGLQVYAEVEVKPNVTE